MKIRNKQRFNKLFNDSIKKKYPDLPTHVYPKLDLKENSSNALTRLVIKWLQLNGWQAERINTTGRMMDTTDTFEDVIGRKRTIGSKKWVKGTSTPGSADISATINGQSVKIEIKFGKDRQSAVQKQYEQAIKDAKGIYIIVRNFDDFVSWYDDFIGYNHEEEMRILDGAIMSYFYSHEQNSSKKIADLFGLKIDYVDKLISRELDKKKK